MKTRAALFTAPGAPQEVTEVVLDDPGPDEVVVRIEAAGVCGSDLHVLRGEWVRPTPMVLGHEGAGIVEAVGADVTSSAVGDHVVVSWAPFCGTCAACGAGQQTSCTTLRTAIGQGTKLDGSTGLSVDGQPVYRMATVGAYAEHVLVPATAALPLPDDVTAEQAALLGCAALTGVGAVERAARVAPGTSVGVIGAGGVGQFAIQGARIAGAEEIVAIDPIEGRRDQALRLGATSALDPSQTSLDEAHPDGLDYVIEAVGSAETMELAVSSVRPGGTVTLVGLPPVGTRLDLDPFALVAQEKTLRGSMYGSEVAATALPRLVEHVREGRLELDPLVGPSYPLERIDEAVAASSAGSAGRVLVCPTA